MGYVHGASDFRNALGTETAGGGATPGEYMKVDILQRHRSILNDNGQSFVI